MSTCDLIGNRVGHDARSELSDVITARDARVAERQGRVVWWLAYLCVVFGGLFIATFVRNRLWQPYVGASLGMIALLATLWVTRPRVALYATLFFATMSDQVAANWFPFVKTLSARESIAYVSDGLTVTPLEISLFIGFVTTTLTRYARTGRALPPNPLTRPMAILTIFVLFGFIRGVATGGLLDIAVFESRGFFYIIVTFAVVISECTRPEHYYKAVLAVFAGVMVHSLLSVRYYLSLSDEARVGLDALGEHGASVTMNLVFIALFAGLLFRSLSRAATVGLLLLTLPVGFIYMVSERRAAIAALAVACAAVLVMLAWRRPRTFLRVVPVLTIVTVAYVGAFWNSTGTVGFPAQALKSVIAPQSATYEDINSDLYRDMENLDVVFTIRASPIFGLGFGHEFYRPIPLPRITSFILARYVPHNSFLWVWIKLGFFGFVTMIYVLTKSIVLGTARARELLSGRDLMTTVLGVSYVVMFAVYTWLDISWDPRLTPVLGLAIAICSQPGVESHRSEPAGRATMADSTVSGTDSGSRLVAADRRAAAGTR